MGLSKSNRPSLTEIAALWRTSRRLYPFYLTLDATFSLGQGPCEPLESPLDRNAPELIEQINQWFECMDLRIEAYHLRQALQQTDFGTEEILRLLIQRHLRNAAESQEHRDKIDFLLVQYVALKLPVTPQSAAGAKEQIAELLQPFVGFVDEGSISPDLLQGPLSQLTTCANLSDLLSRQVLEQVRAVKIRLGTLHLQPQNLIATTYLGFMARVAFVRLLHSDLQHLRFLLGQILAAGTENLDMSSAGLSVQEPVTDLLKICQTWKQPFLAPYSVGMSFKTISEILGIVESAAERAGIAAGSGGRDFPSVTASSAAVADENDETALQAEAHDGCFSIETCIAAIERQIRSTGRMDSVDIAGTNIPLSSWETSAFLSEPNEWNHAVERATAARVLLQLSLDPLRWDAGVREGARSAANAELETIHLQIARARQGEDVEAAVALAASGKRLAMVLEHARETNS